MGIRRLDRCETELSISLQPDPESPRQRARLVDVTAEGIGVEGLEGEAEVGATLYVEIPKQYGLGRVGLLGRVAWRDGDRAGLEIEAMLPHHRERLELLLTTLYRDAG